MEWISVNDRAFPNAENYITGYSFPAIHTLYGYGVVVKQFLGCWAFTNDHKYFVETLHVVYWMLLPEPPKE